jgi:uncharacterized protein YyaL (SSP411 family)
LGKGRIGIITGSELQFYGPKLKGGEMGRLLALLVVAIFSFGFDWSGKVNWALSYSSAQQLAEKEGKLIFVDIGLTTCPPCRYLAERVYTDPKVANYINSHFIPLFYLADRDRVPLPVANYFTGSTPTIMFIKPNGELFTSFIGARPPAQFLEILKRVEAKYKKERN